MIAHPNPPEAGAVLGVDVGFSPIRRSTAVCRLDWTRETAIWTIARCRAVEPERTDTLRRLADRPLAAAAFDGPLAPGLEVIGRYRAAERVLTRGFGRRIGKPGSSGAPVGRQLNEAANACARIVRATGRVAPARHREAIDAAAIVEAFPSSYLGLMIAVPEALAVRRGDRSDVFYMHLAANGALDRVLARLLPVAGRPRPSPTSRTTTSAPRSSARSPRSALPPATIARWATRTVSSSCRHLR